MDRRDDETDVFSTWKRAYHETPDRVRRLIGIAIFVAQAFVSFVITQSRSFFLTRPTLTVGLISGFVILCLFGIVYGLASEIEESEANRRDRMTVSEQDAPFTNRQLTVIEQMITESLRSERSERRSTPDNDGRTIESQFDELRERIEDLEQTEMKTNDVSSLDSEVKENREFIRTVYRTTKQNVDNFEPPPTDDDSGKNQDDTPSTEDRDATESERELA